MDFFNDDLEGSLTKLKIVHEMQKMRNLKKLQDCMLECSECRKDCKEYSDCESNADFVATPAKIAVTAVRTATNAATVKK